MKSQFLAMLCVMFIAGCAGTKSALLDKIGQDVAKTVITDVVQDPTVAAANTVIRAADALANSQVTIVAPGNTLWGLAAKAYNGSPVAPKGQGGYLWNIICEKNNLRDCDLIEVGQVLRYPDARDLLNYQPTEITRHLRIAYAAK